MSLPIPSNYRNLVDDEFCMLLEAKIASRAGELIPNRERLALNEPNCSFPPRRGG